MARAARKIAYAEFARRFAYEPGRPTVAGSRRRKLPAHIKDVLLGIARGGLVLDDTCDWLDREFFDLGDPFIDYELRLLESQAEATLAQKAPPASESAPNPISETPAPALASEQSDPVLAEDAISQEKPAPKPQAKPATKEMSNKKAFRIMKLEDDYEKLIDTSLGKPKEMDAYILLMDHRPEFANKLKARAIAGENVSAFTIREQMKKRGKAVLEEIEAAWGQNLPPESGEQSESAKQPEKQHEEQQLQSVKSESTSVGPVQSVLNRLPPGTRVSQRDRRWLAILCEAYPPDGNPKRDRQAAYKLLQDKTQIAFDQQLYDRFRRKIRPAWDND
jgi:hypothetical protein